MKKNNNKKLKKIYNDIFKKGYENVYTSFLVRGSRTMEIDEVLKQISWKGKKVIDVGCGTGEFAYEAAKKGALVKGIDFSSEAIKKAKKFYQHKNLEYICAEATDIKGKFDVIVSIGTIEHLDNPLEMLLKFKKHLNPKGKIITTTPNWSNPRGYILLPLFYLFNAPITLADLHYFTPIDIINFSKKLKLKIKWYTFDYSWSCGQVLLSDLERRLPNVLKDAKLPTKKRNIDQFIKWIKDHIVPFEKEFKSLPNGGALAIYIFSK